MSLISLKKLERAEELRLEMFAADFTIEQVRNGAPLTIGKYIKVKSDLAALIRPMIEVSCQRDRQNAKAELEALGFQAE